MPVQNMTFHEPLSPVLDARICDQRPGGSDVLKLPCARLQPERDDHERRVREQQPRRTVQPAQRDEQSDREQPAEADGTDDETDGGMSSKARGILIRMAAMSL